MVNVPHRRLIRGALLSFVLLGGILILWGLKTFPPTEHSFYPKCQFHSLTGLHCPGCGMTRSLHSALNGEWKQAVSYNVLAIIVIPVLAITLLRSLWSWMWELPIKSKSSLPWWLPYVIGFVVVLFGIVRNIPFEPFSLLAPHEIVKQP